MPVSRRHYEFEELPVTESILHVREIIASHAELKKEQSTLRSERAVREQKVKRGELHGMAVEAIDEQLRAIAATLNIDHRNHVLNSLTGDLKDCFLRLKRRKTDARGKTAAAYNEVDLLQKQNYETTSRHEGLRKENYAAPRDYGAARPLTGSDQSRFTGGIADYDKHMAHDQRRLATLKDRLGKAQSEERSVNEEYEAFVNWLLYGQPAGPAS